VLVELSVVELRYQAVLEVVNQGAAVTDVAVRFGVTRQTVHRWLRRYAAQGLAGLVDGTAKPLSCPHQLSPEVEALIVELRRSRRRGVGDRRRRSRHDPRVLPASWRDGRSAPSLEERLGRTITHDEENTVAKSTRAPKTAVDPIGLKNDWLTRADRVGFDIDACFDRVTRPVAVERLGAEHERLLFDELVNPNIGLCAESNTCAECLELVDHFC
jgi:transposase-like protein